MRREIELKRRLRSLEALGDAVGAMKSLSAHHFREARRALEPARPYREGVERMLHRSGATLAAGTEGAGLLVIGAELGLCGSYNSRIVRAAVEHRARLGEGPTYCVGHRAAMLLARGGVEVAGRYATPMSVDGIPALLLRLVEDMLTTYETRRLSRFDLLWSRFAGVSHASPTSMRMLPMDVGPAAGGGTTRYVPPERFAFTAVREFLYITLHGLLLDALASENGARLLATQSAEQWLDERTTALRRHLAATRREAGTQEVLEIAAGVRARRRADPSRPTHRPGR